MKFSELKTGDYFKFECDVAANYNKLRRKLAGKHIHILVEELTIAEHLANYDVMLCDENGKQIERLFSFDEIPNGSFFRAIEVERFVRLKYNGVSIIFFNDSGNLPIIEKFFPCDKKWKVIPKPDWLKINF